MSLADDLETANVAVVKGRRRIGRPASAVEFVLTNTGKSNEGADDVNNIAMPARATAYVERSGRVWVLADGPVSPGPAVVYVAAYKTKDQTEAQNDSIAVISALIGSADIAEPEPEPEPETEPETPKTEPESDPESDKVEE